METQNRERGGEGKVGKYNTSMQTKGEGGLERKVVKCQFHNQYFNGNEKQR